MSKRGMAIAETGDSDEDDTEVAGKLKKAFRHTVSQTQAKALTFLAREEGGKRRRKTKSQ